MEYEPVGVLSTEVERLKEGILAQLQALRWQVVDFTVSDALQAVSDAGGVVELRLQVSSDVWREKTNEERERAKQRAKEEERAKREEAERVERESAEERQKGQAQDQLREETEAEERQRTLEKGENEEKKHEELCAVSMEEELRLRREWEAVKEQARRKVFDEVRREQDQRMLFALNLRESFGLKKTSEPRHTGDYSLPFEMPTYADDPFPVGAIAPASPTITIAASSSSSSPFGSPSIAAEAVDTLPLGGAGHSPQHQQHGAPGVRAIALSARKPARNWQAELRPGLVFVIDARLGDDSGLAEEWWIGRKFGDESAPRRAVPAGLVYALHGDARMLGQQSLGDLLRQEGIDADREVMMPIANPAQQDAEQVLPRPMAVAAPAGSASESGDDQKQKNEAAEALKRESEREAERGKERLLAREEQERKAREAAEELRKRQEEEEEARRKRQAESERKAATQEKAPNTMPPPADHKDNADKSRPTITAGAYNMMPVPVMSSEIEAAIKERGRRKSANLGADAIVERPEASRQREMERDRRRSATAAVLMQQQQQHQPQPQMASEGQLRPPPPSRMSRRSLDPSAAPLPAPSEAEGGSAPPPLPPLPSALPPPASAVALARDKRLSLPAHVLLKRNEEAIAAAAAAAGPPPALPPMPSSGIGPSSGQQTVSASALPTNPRSRAVPPASAASSDALSTRGDKRKSWNAADDASAGPLASSASSVPTAAASLAKREALGFERQRSATVLGPGTSAPAAVPQRTASSSALRAQTLRPSKSSSGGSSKDKLDKEEKKKDKEEKKKKKDEEKEKKRKEKEKKKEDKKKKKG